MLYKSKILTLVTIGYSCCIMMSIVIGPKWPFNSICNYIGLLGTGFIQVMYLGRAPRKKETLPDCLKWRRVTRHPLVFRGLTGSQRTPGFRASHSHFEGRFHKVLRDWIPGFGGIKEGRQRWSSRESYKYGRCVLLPFLLHLSLLLMFGA